MTLDYKIKTKDASKNSMEIESMPIFVIDDLFSEAEIGDLFEDISSRTYTREEYDFVGDEHPICSFDFEIRDFQTNHLVGIRSYEMLQAHFPDEKHRLNRAYVNRCSYGDVEYPHRDCVGYSKNVSALYYVNKSWDYRWGGETKFYNRGDTRYAVLPKPGRLVLFRGAIEHMGSIPTRVCTDPRFTLAMKYSSRAVKTDQER